MNRRRRGIVSLLLVCLALVLCVAPGVSQAGIVTWSFSGNDVAVVAPNTADLNTFADPLVPAGPYTYNWTIDITNLYLQFAGFLWIGTGEKIFETGQHVGSIPFTMISSFERFIQNGEFVIEAQLDVNVDSDGKGHFDISQVRYGTFGGSEVTGIKADGTITVEWAPVPEPSTAMLFLGGIAPLGWIAYRRRRR